MEVCFLLSLSVFLSVFLSLCLSLSVSFFSFFYFPLIFLFSFPEVIPYDVVVKELQATTISHSSSLGVRSGGRFTPGQYPDALLISTKVGNLTVHVTSNAKLLITFGNLRIFDYFVPFSVQLIFVLTFVHYAHQLKLWLYLNYKI